ncbi:MAG: hypothetical protein WC666_01055 [Candidatus Paceibacterota bacterium]|jgi:hypothetical protein
MKCYEKELSEQCAPSDKGKSFNVGDIVKPIFVPIDPYKGEKGGQQIVNKIKLIVTGVKRSSKRGGQIITFAEVLGSYESDFFEKVDS